jgi:hypothetical protein
MARMNADGKGLEPFGFWDKKETKANDGVAQVALGAIFWD